MPDPKSNFVSDGGVLLVAASGLEIVRRQKHEWFAGLSKLPPDRLAKMTNRVWGSKFLESWQSQKVAEWIAGQITAAGWTKERQAPHRLDIIMPDVIGLADGRPVHTIRIVSDGRYVHAYPIKDPI
jgi:hypothetical protein